MTTQIHIFRISPVPRFGGMCLEAFVLGFGFGRKLPLLAYRYSLSLSSPTPSRSQSPYSLLSFHTRCGNLFPHDHKIMPPPPSAFATSVPLDDSLDRYAVLSSGMLYMQQLLLVSVAAARARHDVPHTVCDVMSLMMTMLEQTKQCGRRETGRCFNTLLPAYMVLVHGQSSERSELMLWGVGINNSVVSGLSSLRWQTLAECQASGKVNPSQTVCSAPDHKFS